VKKVKPATHLVYLASLNFLYRRTLRRPEEVEQIPWPKVPRHLPVVPTGEQVRRLFEAIRSIKHRAILMAAYGAGLRISEACSLQVQDIDSKRMLIHVRHAAFEGALRNAQPPPASSSPPILDCPAAFGSLPVSRTLS
jgi:site-specific recombinase XerC